MGSVNPSIDLAHDGEIAVVTIDNPPVNALKHEVRAGLIEAFQRVRNDAGVKAAVLACAGRTFSAGADISEFGKPRRSPGLIEVIETIESVGKPVVAALHGTPLGGGFELALGCHYRVAAPGTRVGLPEIKLGLLPGAGGTQRLPRLIGPERALQLIVSGNPTPVEELKEDGVVDAIVTGDVAEEAIAFARKVVSEKRPLTRVRDREDRLAAARADPSGFTRAADASTKRARGLRAVAACVESVRNSFDKPFDEGQARELELFMELLTSEESRAQRHIFFAEREAQKVPDMPAGVKPREVAQRRRHRRRHHGRRHRHELRQCRHPGDARRDRAGRARPRACDDPEELRQHGLARRADAGGGATAASRSSPARPTSTALERCRLHHRGGVRGDGPQEAHLRRPRPDREAGRDPRHQHLDARRERDRRRRRSARRTCSACISSARRTS